MSVHTSACVWAECDGPRCDRDKGWPDEGPYHFASEQAALEYVLGEAGIGWTELPDGRLLCRRCSEAADCEATGHQWTDWRPGYKNGHPDPTIELRFCTPLRRRIRRTPCRDGRHPVNNPQLIAPAATVLPEVSPSSQWCQRWTAGRHSWRHTSEGGFDPARYLVEPISEDTARTWVVQHHYSGSYRTAALRRYGLLNRAGTLLGVCVLGIPMSPAVLTKVFPDLEPMVESLELSRLVLADQVPGNGESWFIARALADAAEAGVRGVVAFADPCHAPSTAGPSSPAIAA